MFCSSNLKTFRFVPPKSSLEKAEKRNTVEQKLLDKKLKFFESEQTIVQRELHEIRKEKYSRNFYRTSPHIEDERLQHSRFVDVAVSTNKQDGNDNNNKQPEPQQKLNSSSTRVKKKEERRALISASGVERTISSMKNASTSSKYSCTPGQVVRVSIPAELESKIKVTQEFDAKKFLAKRRHSVHLGSGISGKLLFAEHLLNLTKNDDTQRETNAVQNDKLQVRRRMSLPSQPLVAFQRLLEEHNDRCSDIIEEEEEEDFVDDDIDVDDLYIKDDPSEYQLQYVDDDNEDKMADNNCSKDDENNNNTKDVNNDNGPDDRSEPSASSMIARQQELPSLDCVSLSSRSNSFTENNFDQDGTDAEKLIKNEPDGFIIADEDSSLQSDSNISDSDNTNHEQTTGDILQSMQSFATNFTLPAMNSVAENTAPFVPQPPDKSSNKPKRVRKRSQSLSIPFSRIRKGEESASKNSKSLIHPALTQRRGSYSHPKLTRRKSLSNEEGSKNKNETDSAKTTQRRVEANLSKTSNLISLSNENVAHISASQHGKTSVAKTLSLNIDNLSSNHKTTMESLNEQFLNTAHRLANRTQSNTTTNTFENFTKPKIPIKESEVATHRPLSRATSEKGRTTKKDHFPSMNLHRAVLRTKSSNDSNNNVNSNNRNTSNNRNNNTKVAVRIQNHQFPQRSAKDDELHDNEIAKHSQRKMKLHKSFSTPCNGVAGYQERSNSIAAIHTITFPTSRLVTPRRYHNALETASKAGPGSFKNCPKDNREKSSSLPSVHSKDSSNGSECEFPNHNDDNNSNGDEPLQCVNSSLAKASVKSSASSSKRITDREQHNDGHLPQLSSPVASAEYIDVSPVEESLLRQAYLKRVEIQEKAEKMTKLSQNHFGDSRAPRTRRALAKTPVFRAIDNEKSSSGIKVYDLSGKTRKWKRYVRRNSEEIEGVLHSVNDVTDCRYLRCASMNNSK